jgi:hypothetical protein
MPYASPVLACIRISHGQRVTIPLPRGKKLWPTMFSSTEDFPAD